MLCWIYKIIPCKCYEKYDDWKQCHCDYHHLEPISNQKGTVLNACCWIDGDFTFDMTVDPPLMHDGKSFSILHCEITPCYRRDPKMKDFITKLKQLKKERRDRIEVEINGKLTWDGGHGRLEIHPVTDAKFCD